jgi:hypothetical protein
MTSSIFASTPLGSGFRTGGIDRKHTTMDFTSSSLSALEGIPRHERGDLTAVVPDALSNRPHELFVRPVAGAGPRGRA